MLFAKKNHLVGLDIGSRTIKVAEITGLNKGGSFKAFGLIDIPPGLIEDGAIKEPEKVAEFIRELFSTYKIKEHNVATSIGGYSVIVKKIDVQTISEEQLQENIHLEAEQYIPYDINDVYLDFHIIGENENNANLTSVLLTAAKKEMVDDYAGVIDMAGLTPCVVDVDAFALQNIFEFTHGGGDENVALIDIGSSKTSLNILKNNQSLFMRDVSLGCAQINHKIASMADCSPEEAEEIKLTGKSDTLSSEQIKEIISTIVADWCQEIRRALDFFYSTYPDDQIKRIVLSGGGANIKEFRELLGVETSAEVEVINPFAPFKADSGRLDPAYLSQVAPQAAICMGLATRRIDDK